MFVPAIFAKIYAMRPNRYHPLKKYFTAVPANYDRINRLMTWRLDQRYRKRMAKLIVSSEACSFLDVGAGTGDLTLQIASHDPTNRIALTALDFSDTMLAEMARKTASLNHSPIRRVLGDASQMPFEEAQFDAAGTAFAFRNMTFENEKSEKILQEYYRVIKPGGKLYILETSRPSLAPIRWLFHLYLYFAAGLLGGILSGNHEAYRYLARSATHFYSRKTIRNMIQKAGFVEVKQRPVLMGMLAITIASK
ncbi:MAG: hypothetical protein CSA95_04575 [Bacteroidetes bacterium]|nr:MAG: hypothetical protein CSA95_04575 [Bacteroidota bacterium]